MNHLISKPEEVIETPDGVTRVGANTRPIPGTWEDEVFAFAGCYALEDTARRDLQEETRQPPGRLPARDVTRDPVAELLTVASAVETFLEGYLKANPGHALATVPRPGHRPAPGAAGPIACSGREGGMTEARSNESAVLASASPRSMTTAVFSMGVGTCSGATRGDGGSQGEIPPPPLSGGNRSNSDDAPSSLGKVPRSIVVTDARGPDRDRWHAREGRGHEASAL